ncbi:MAG: tungstate ABC transporter substrate-binding protein WtpA [Thermoplasmata archaeon]
MNHEKVVAILAIVIMIAVPFSGCLGGSSKTVLKVYAAGSLATMFGEFERRFEAAHSDVDVQVQSGGSADMIRKITDLKQDCDVLAVADYSLIDNMMINSATKTANYSIQFARNSIIIAYTSHSKYKDEVNSTNWYQILRRSDVKFGFSNPNDDPCGYRANMVIKLAERYYNDSYIYRDLVANNTNLCITYNTTTNATTNVTTNITMINAPSNIQVTNTNKVMVRSAEVDLTSALEVGEIDYLFIYDSIAKQHTVSGTRYIILPMEINLNNSAFNSNYSKVNVAQFADNTANRKEVSGKAIVYGITVPFSATKYDLAVQFVAMVISQSGLAVVDAYGQEPVSPPKCIQGTSLPNELKTLVA